MDKNTLAYAQNLLIFLEKKYGYRGPIAPKRARERFSHYDYDLYRRAHQVFSQNELKISNEAY